MCFEQTKEANHFLCKKKIAFRVNSEIVVEFSQYGRRHRTGARLKVPVEQRNHSVPAGCPQEEFPVNTAAQQALDRIFTLISELVARARSEKRESGSSVEGALFHARVKPGRRSRIAPQRGERIWRKIELRI